MSTLLDKIQKDPLLIRKKRPIVKTRKFLYHLKSETIVKMRLTAGMYSIFRKEHKMSFTSFILIRDKV